MSASEDKDWSVRSQPIEGLESPFLGEELFTGKSEEEWKAQLATVEAESPFAWGIKQVASPAAEPEVEEERTSQAGAPYAEEELEDYVEEELEDLEWEDRIAPAEFGEAYEDEEPEYVEEEFEAYEEEGPEEEALAISYTSEDSASLPDEEGLEPELQDALPLLFDAEHPASEEEVDEEAGLPTGPADGWVIPQDVVRAGENQPVRYDDAPSWDENRKDSICSGQLSEGGGILRRYLLDNYPKIREIGGYNCRRNSATSNKLSIHGTGRALDIMIPTIDGRANSTIGDPIANWLIVNASAIGVQYLIWNRVRWSGGRPRLKFARYTGPNPHRDHIHVELNLDGAQGKTPWFSGRAVPAGVAAGEEVAAGEDIDYEKAVRLNRVYGIQLGWQGRLPEMTRFLGLASGPPEERAFAGAVARWQRQQGLGVDGILGPSTWERMRSTLPVAPVATSPPVTGSPSTSDWAQVDPSQRRRYVMGLLVKNYQYPENGAAGIVGNLWAESKLLPNAIEGSSMRTPMRARDFTGKMTEFTAEQVMNRNYKKKKGPQKKGIGLAQWTYEARRRGLFNHTFQGRKLGANILYNMDAQVDYLVTELRTLSEFRRVNNILRRANVSLEEASDEVVYNFERPGSILTPKDPDGQRRNLPRNHPAVKKTFNMRRDYSRKALRAYQEPIPR